LGCWRGPGNGDRDGNRDCGKSCDILDGGVLSSRVVEWYTSIWGGGERKQTMDGNGFEGGGCEMVRWRSCMC